MRSKSYYSNNDIKQIEKNTHKHWEAKVNINECEIHVLKKYIIFSYKTKLFCDLVI